MAEMDDLENELKELLVDALALEDVKANEIDSEAALFGDGLGLGSIDALELAMALSKTYGVRLQPENDEAKRAFASVRTLAEYIRAQKSLSGAS